MKKITALSFTLILMVSLRAQNIDGDALFDIIGSKVTASATISFLNANEVINTTGAIYSTSKNGIDMMASHDTLVSMTLYRENPIYGHYTGRLPKDLSFDMSSNDITKKLGKPTTSYMNSGYAEYEFGKYILTCWFEKEVLRRITISLK